MILFFTWLIAGLIVGLYIWSFVHRYRRDKRKAAAEIERASAASEAIFRAAKLAEQQPAAPVAAAPDVPAETAPMRGTSVAEALAGITLPSGLVPLTTMAEAQLAGDRVAFWTDAAASVVGPAFAAEVERLGYAMTPIDEKTLAIQRDQNRLSVTIYPDAHAAVTGKEPLFPTVPEGAVVIEVRVVL